jgi:quercetin dioxygenase-like cupin family protein
MSLRIVGPPAETASSLLEMGADDPPGSSAPPAHLHPRQEERFPILDGAMRAELGGTRRERAAGERLVIPAGTPHTMWNAGAASSRVNRQVRPALRTEELFQVVFSLAARGRVDAHGVPGLLELALLVPHSCEQLRVTTPPAWVQRLAFGALAPLSRRLHRCPELRSPSWRAH